MLLQTVIDRQVSRQPGVSLLIVLARHGVGPFLVNGLNKPPGLVFGTQRLGSGADVPELQDAAVFGNGLENVGRSVVPHHFTKPNAITVEPGQCPIYQVDRCDLLFIRQHLYVGKHCGVINSYLDQVLPDADRPVLLLVACDAVTNLVQAVQPPVVDDNQIAGPLQSLVLNRRLWIKVSHPD